MFERVGHDTPDSVNAWEHARAVQFRGQFGIHLCYCGTALRLRDDGRLPDHECEETP